MPDHPYDAPALRRPMLPRDPAAPHRAATPLELLYDLCFVVAIAQAAAALHHSLSAGHCHADCLITYAKVFFAVWWAWMNFTWFASAFDTDDAIYRLKVLVQMVGVVILAAGVPRAFDAHDFSLIAAGYVVMRLGLVAQWVRAALNNPDLRTTALRYALGTTAVQALWVVLILGPPRLNTPGFALLVLAELAVPVVAERARPTPWHPHHIAERYGLLTIIVIGESVLAAVLAVQQSLDAHTPLHALLPTLLGAPLIFFSMWWLYFSKPHAALLGGFRQAFVWGYGHLPIYAAAAAVGAGLAVTVDAATDHAHLTPTAAGYALATPAALYLASLWFVLIRPQAAGLRLHAAFATAILLTLATPFAPATPLCLGAILAVLTAVTITSPHPEPET